jgi:hypothetical protein
MLQGFTAGIRLNQILTQLGENSLIAEQLGRLIIHHEDIYFVRASHAFP